MELLLFWKKHHKKLPLNINNTEILTEYYNDVQLLNDFTKIESLPSFIKTRNMAEIYLWVKYSVSIYDSNNWKMSEQTLLQKFDDLQR